LRFSGATNVITLGIRLTYITNRYEDSEGDEAAGGVTDESEEDDEEEEEEPDEEDAVAGMRDFPLHPCKGLHYLTHIICAHIRI